MTYSIDRVEDIVKRILEEDEDARNDDLYLYSRVVATINPTALHKSLATFLLRFEELEIPKESTVSRARRKLQAMNPNLRATEEIQQKRYEQAILFGEYSVR